MALKTITLLYSIIKVTFSSYDLYNKNNPEVWQTLVKMTAGKEVCNKTFENAIKLRYRQINELPKRGSSLVTL